MLFKAAIKLCLFLAVFAIACQLNAQNTVSSGNWSDPSVWSTGVVPTGSSTVNVNNPLILDQNVTISTGTYNFFQNVTDLPGGASYGLTATTVGGTLDIKAGTTTFGGSALDNSTLFVRSGATLILGPTTINNNASITIEVGGTLIINGDLTNNNNGVGLFTISGTLIVNGNYLAPVGSVDVSGSGQFFTTGTITTNGSSNVFGSTNNCASGPCSGRNLCSFTNTIAADQTICSGSTPAVLTGATSAGSPAYLWESSTASSTSGFAAASGTNNAATYSPPSLTQTTWYRRSVTSGGCTGITVAVQITVPAGAGWNGTADTNWHNASNWCSGVPTATTDVTINSGVPNMPSISTGSAVCRDLTIGSGATVTIAGATLTLDIKGNFTNNGTLSANATSKVSFSGTSQQTVAGSNPPTFNDLTFNNTFGTSPQLILSNFVSVNSILMMTAGNINLSTYNLTLGTSAGATGTLSYSSGWFYNGNLTRWIASPVIPDGNVRGLFPMGTSSNTRPFYVSFPSVVPTTGGTIRVGHTGATTTSTLSIADTGGPIVRRQDSFWQVATNTLAGGTYNLRGEGTGFGTVGNVADLRLMLAASVVGTAGTNAGTLTVPQVLRTGLTLANLTNNFYIGSVNAAGSPLPVTLTEFYGTVTAGGVDLRWVTESEVNFDHFQIENSNNGEAFRVLAQKEGKGTFSSRSDYSYFDAKASGRTYYRLKIVDLDGSFALSKTIMVEADEQPTRVLIYPNPIVNRTFTIESNDRDPSKALISIVDQLGKNCWSKEFENPIQEFQLSESIPQGIYFLKISKGTTLKTIKVIIL